MRKMKYIIGFIFLFMIIGYATISVSLSIGGDANILSNADDFKVYFSNVLVNDKQDLRLVKNDKELVFEVNLKELGETQKITYDVTNASSVFDASLSINCTQGDELISITNEFDTSTNLLAKSTRTGNLTLSKIKTNPSETDSRFAITCTIVASPVSRETIDSGSVIAPVQEAAILKATSSSDTTAFRSSLYKTQIKTITFEDEINVPDNAIESWDIGEAQNGNVMAYVTPNETNSAYYDLHIQSDTQLYANSDMSYWFNGLSYVDSINGLELLDTSTTTNMGYMFYSTGYYNSIFNLDVSGLDTSNVTNMSSMFERTGYNSTVFTLDVSNFDTSNVTNMSSMFKSTGYNSTVFTLDLGDNFDTSNVTNMANMFSQTGYYSTIFTLDVSNFDTSKVTKMSNMFESTGINSTTFTLDVSNFDTSKVTDMSSMFKSTGYTSENFTLDVSNFDTSNVTNMSGMFARTGGNSTTFTLDVSNFDTSNVTNMSGMFERTGGNSTTFTLDVSNFDTSNVTNMGGMFERTGSNSTTFTLDVSNFDTSNVTNMNYMFFYTGYNSTKFVTSITIKNPNTTSYSNMFGSVATKTGSQITVNYTSATSSLVDQMIATKSSNSNVVKGVLKVDIDNISIGDEITINNEHFNVISQTKDTITMLAQYNLGTDYRQSTTANTLRFSESKGWEYYPGPKEIEISQYGGNADTYLKNYAAYLNNIVKDSNISSNLITMTTLKNLGCTITDNYSISSETLSCTNSQHVLWLVNGQSWWTRSAYSGNADDIWIVSTDGSLYGFQQGNFYGGRYGIRPIITISKNVLKLE